jgi:hypothetical protein
MTYTYNFSRLEPIYSCRAQTGICNLVVGLNCTATIDTENGPISESAYIDKAFPLDPNLDYETLTGNLQTYANDFATEEGWWDSLKVTASGKFTRPVHGASLLNIEGLTIEANPVG